MERRKPNEIKKIHLTIGGKNLGTIDIEKLSDKEKDEILWKVILLENVPIIYAKDTVSQMRIGEGLTRRFKVKKSFVFHGFKGANIYVTIPVSLDTLKALGFISKVKG